MRAAGRPNWQLLAGVTPRGEVLGLSWRDVDTGNGVIRVRQQPVRAGGRLRLGPVKSAAGRRELPLIGIANDVLGKQADMRIVGSLPNELTAHELVFTTKTGRPVEPRNLARSFDRIITRAGLRPIRLHDLRPHDSNAVEEPRCATAGHDGDPRPRKDRGHDGDLHLSGRDQPPRRHRQAQPAPGDNPSGGVAVTVAVNQYLKPAAATTAEL
jgi:hypothetical protein